MYVNAFRAALEARRQQIGLWVSLANPVIADVAGIKLLLDIGAQSLLVPVVDGADEPERRRAGDHVGRTPGQGDGSRWRHLCPGARARRLPSSIASMHSWSTKRAAACGT
jgi:hypothetical protein